MEAYKYKRVELSVPSDTEFVKVIRPSGEKETVLPFKYQPIKISYDDEGIERVLPDGDVEMHCRYTPDFTGEATLEIHGKKMSKVELTVLPSDEHGYIEVGKTDSKYFAFSDGTPFFSVGINTAFPTVFSSTDGTEFGRSDTHGFMGLRQYERWFAKLSANGVNVARVWVGHEYFCPDKEQICEFDYLQFSKIDKLVELAKKYSIKLKLTLDQFRYFNYERVAESASYEDDLFRKFNKRLCDGELRCGSVKEWLTDERWKSAWLCKVKEFSKRYANDTAIFAIELWNEMNTLGFLEDVIEWNREMLPKVKELFPKNLVCNSIGSLGNEDNNKMYRSFCWEHSAFVQVHRYLDQGAGYADCRGNMTDVVKGAFEKITSDRPVFLAETGAVNNNHTGPFKFYACDDRGILFADAVYTPVFLKSAGTGNIWHWDERYVEFKNLYSMFVPISELVKDVDFEHEGFVSMDFSDENISLLLLCGKTTALGYIRNKDDSWQKLRDLETPRSVDGFEFALDGAKNVSCIPIWQEDRTSATVCDEAVKFQNIDYGSLFKVNFG